MSEGGVLYIIYIYTHSVFYDKGNTKYFQRMTLNFIRVFFYSINIRLINITLIFNQFQFFNFFSLAGVIKYIFFWIVPFSFFWYRILIKSFFFKLIYKVFFCIKNVGACWESFKVSIYACFIVLYFSIVYQLRFTEFYVISFLQ